MEEQEDGSGSSFLLCCSGQGKWGLEKVKEEVITEHALKSEQACSGQLGEGYSTSKRDSTKGLEA